MAIDARHPLYSDNIDEWNKIDNVCDGRDVKKYLLEINPTDTSDENKARNDTYKKRAVFYTLAGQTVSGMLGTVFEKWPTWNVPDPNLAYLEKNADGAGSSIYQQSQATTEECIRKGRCGLYVSYPPTNGPISMADRGRYFATIQKCTAQQIINWREITVDAETKLSLIVIEDTVEEPSETDKYTLENVKEIRELYLDQDVDEEGNPVGELTYRERHWRELVSSERSQIKTDPNTGRVTDDNSGWYLKADFEPRNSKGQPFTEILFTFVGAQNNNPDIDVPPMAGIVDLNVGHHRNSADHEDELFFCAQAQPFINSTEVSQDQLDHFKENGGYWMSRRLMPFPVDIAQQTPNSALRQAMLDKVDQMVGIGARMMQPGSAVKTATQAGGEQKVQHSVLSLIASNVSEAYDKCLKWVAEYMGASADMEYKLNQEFEYVSSDAQELQTIGAMFQQGIIPADDYVAYMKKRGYFREDVSVDDYRGLVSQNLLIE